MKARKLLIQATAMGMSMNLITLKIGNPAKERELSSYTELVCPKDNKKPDYVPSGYRCGCGFTATTWQSLKRVLKGTTTPLDMPTLTKGNGEVEVAKMYRMTVEAFAKIADFVDPKDGDHPVTTEDDASTMNLYRVLVAQQTLNEVVILKWNDTKEEIIALLTTTLSGKIVIRKIIPPNLVIVGDSLMLDKTKLTAKDIEEAKQFMKQIAEVDEKALEVTDYRAKQLTVAPPEKQKVISISNIMAKALGRKEIVDKTNKTELLVTVQTKSKKKQK